MTTCNDILLFFRQIEARPSHVHNAIQVFPLKVGYWPNECPGRLYEGWASCFPGRAIQFCSTVAGKELIREFDLPRPALLATGMLMNVRLEMPAIAVNSPVFVSTIPGCALHERSLTVKMDVDFVLALPTAQWAVRIANAMSRGIARDMAPFVKAPPRPTLGSRIAAELAQTRIGAGAYLRVHDAEKKHPGVLWLRREITTGVFDAVVYTPEELPVPCPREWHQSLIYTVAKVNYDEQVLVATALT